MRTHIFGGLALLVIGPLAVLLGSGLDLELDSTVFMGLAIGAALALVPDRAPALRLGAFVAGLGAAWVTYLVRAGFTPDTAGGRAASMAVLVALCLVVTLVSVGRLPLWAVLLGAAALAGGYEAAYAAAPSEVVSTSLSAVTSVLLTAGIGYLAGSLGGALRPAEPRPARAGDPVVDGSPSTDVDPDVDHGVEHDSGLGLVGGAR